MNRKEFQLINVEADGFVSLMLEDGTMKEDLKLPADEPEAINYYFNYYIYSFVRRLEMILMKERNF